MQGRWTVETVASDCVICGHVHAEKTTAELSIVVGDDETEARWKTQSVGQCGSRCGLLSVVVGEMEAVGCVVNDWFTRERHSPLQLVW